MSQDELKAWIYTELDRYYEDVAGLDEDEYPSHAQYLEAYKQINTEYMEKFLKLVNGEVE